MALTIVEQEKLAKSDLDKGVYNSLLKAAPLMKRVPWDSIGTLSRSATRWQSLPDVGFRSINDTFEESTGKFEQIQEPLSALGGLIDIDHLLLDDQNTIVNVRAEQVDMKMQAIAHTFSDYLVNGDLATTPEGFDGLKVRISSMPSTQIIDAGALDLSTGTARGTSAQTFLDYLHQLIYMVERGTGGKPDVLLMNDTTYLYTESTIRRGGLLRQDQDSFGRVVNSYMGVELIDVGFKADQSTKIIPDNHDGTTGITSIYAVRFGSQYLQGLQMGPLQVKNLGRTQDGIWERTFIEWTVGLMVKNQRACARLRNLKIA